MGDHGGGGGGWEIPEAGSLPCSAPQSPSGRVNSLDSHDSPAGTRNDAPGRGWKRAAVQGQRWPWSCQRQKFAEQGSLQVAQRKVKLYWVPEGGSSTTGTGGCFLEGVCCPRSVSQGWRQLGQMPRVKGEERQEAPAPPCPGPCPPSEGGSSVSLPPCPSFPAGLAVRYTGPSPGCLGSSLLLRALPG